MLRPDSKIANILTKIADMFILSFYWLIGSLLIVTFIPSCCALYQCASKVLRHDAGKLTQEFFKTWKNSMRQGIVLSIFCMIFGVILYAMKIFYESQGVETNLGKVYFVCVLVFAFLFLCVLYYLIPVITRFSVTLSGAFRLSLYFGSKNLFTMIPLIITFLGAVALVYVIPYAILFIPGFYAWFWALPVEKSFRKYIMNDLPNPEEHEGMWYMEE